MKKINLLLFLVILCATGNSQYLLQMNKDTVVYWTYDWGDEFDSTAVDTKKWEYWYGWARNIYGNKEQQYYSDGRNHEFKDGVLTLTAKKQTLTARLVDWRPDNDSIFDDRTFMGLNKRIFNYTAGMLQSNKLMVGGYFEIKFRMSPGKGYWPAFWVAGGTPNEEIDFFELKTEKKNAIHVGRHAVDDKENYLPYFLFKKKLWGDWVKFKGDLTQNYNVVSGEWNKDYIKYYLNGECIAYTKIHLQEPKRVAVNIAVPGNGPFKPGPSKKDTTRAEFQIDHIRIWQQSANGQVKKAQKPIIHNLNLSREIAHTALTSKSKFLYGKKSDHKQEGFLVSVTPAIHSKYELTVLGKSIPADAVYVLYDGEGKKLAGAPLKYGESVLDLGEFKTKEFVLVVEAFGKKATCYLAATGD